MVDATNLAYSYKGYMQNLLTSVEKACEKMSLVLKDESANKEGFSIKVAQKTNWLSTNWPMKFNITASQLEKLTLC